MLLNAMQRHVRLDRRGDQSEPEAVPEELPSSPNMADRRLQDTGDGRAGQAPGAAEPGMTRAVQCDEERPEWALADLALVLESGHRAVRARRTPDVVATGPTRHD